MKRYFLRSNDEHERQIPLVEAEAAVGEVPGMRREGARHFVFESATTWQFMDVFLDACDPSGTLLAPGGELVNRIRLEIVPRAFHGDERDSSYLAIAERIADALLLRVWDANAKVYKSRTLFDRGYELLGREDWEGGCRFLERASEEDPENTHVWRQLAYSQWRTGRPEEAFHSATRAIEISDTNWANWFELGRCHDACGRLTEAMAAFDRAIALSPREPMPHNNKCATLNQLGRHPEAMAAIEQILALRPDDAFSLYNKACTHRFLGDRASCLRVLRQAFSLDPELREEAPKEPELEPLWSDPEFIALCAERDLEIPEPTGQIEGPGWRRPRRRGRSRR